MTKFKALTSKQDKKDHKNFRKLRKQRKSLFNEIVD